jgi:predicted amidophosphoribosyltransferase
LICVVRFVLCSSHLFSPAGLTAGQQAQFRKENDCRLKGAHIGTHVQMQHSFNQ